MLPTFLPIGSPPKNSRDLRWVGVPSADAMALAVWSASALPSATSASTLLPGALGAATAAAASCRARTAACRGRSGNRRRWRAQSHWTARSRPAARGLRRWTAWPCSDTATSTGCAGATGADVDRLGRAAASRPASAHPGCVRVSRPSAAPRARSARRGAAPRAARAPPSASACSMPDASCGASPPAAIGFGFASADLGSDLACASDLGSGSRLLRTFRGLVRLMRRRQFRRSASSRPVRRHPRAASRPRRGARLR